MSQTKINFTKENKESLFNLAGEALVKGTKFKGSMNTELTIYDLFHNCNINTLERYYGNLEKEVEAISKVGRWNLTSYQQRKKLALENQKELIDLLIGYKKFVAEQEASRKEYRDMKAQYDQLKENTKTPEERLKEMEAKLAGFGDEAKAEPEVVD